MNQWLFMFCTMICYNIPVKVHFSRLGRCTFIGKEDLSLVRYYEDEERYADLLNGYVFEGRQVISAKDVVMQDSRKTGVQEESENKKKLHQRYRDSVRSVIFGVNCVLIAIENQDLIHYAMPIRVMSGDAMEYDEQLRGIQRYHKKMNDLTNAAEFLGKYAKTDKVPAAISLVVYYGKEPWDGARDLYDLLDLTDVPDELRKMVNHYPIYVLEVHKFQNTEWFQTDLREVFAFIQLADDKEKLAEFVEQSGERLDNMSADACEVIAAVTKTKEFMFRDARYRNAKGGVNMCKGMLDWLAEKEELGLQRGLQHGIQQGLEQGRQQGLEQGRQQGLEQAADALFLHGMSVEEIAAVFQIEMDMVKLWYERWKKSIVATAAV